MDFAQLIKSAFDFFAKVCEVEFEVAGITYTYGNAIVWICLAGLILWFWHGLRGE